MYELLKDLDTPFYSFKKWEKYSVYEWLDKMWYDWVSTIEECITDSEEWFKFIK